MKRVKVTGTYAFPDTELRKRLRSRLARSAAEYGLTVVWVSDGLLEIRRGRFLEAVVTIGDDTLDVSVELSWGLQLYADEIAQRLTEEVTQLCALPRSVV